MKDNRYLIIGGALMAFAAGMHFALWFVERRMRRGVWSLDLDE